MLQPKIVLVSGAFDGLHAGHLDFLRQAKSLGDELVVVIGRDAVIEKIKGKKPVHHEQDRLSLVSQLKLVDRAVLGTNSLRYDIIKQINPDIIALGYDQMPEEELQKQLNLMSLQPKIVRLQGYQPQKYKSTLFLSCFSVILGMD